MRVPMSASLLSLRLLSKISFPSKREEARTIVASSTVSIDAFDDVSSFSSDAASSSSRGYSLVDNVRTARDAVFCSNDPTSDLGFSHGFVDAENGGVVTGPFVALSSVEPSPMSTAIFSSDTFCTAMRFFILICRDAFIFDICKCRGSDDDDARLLVTMVFLPPLLHRSACVVHPPARRKQRAGTKLANNEHMKMNLILRDNAR